MKILYLAANPQWVKVDNQEEHREYGRLELWQELRGVSDVLFDARAEGSVVLEVVPEARRRDVVRYLNRRHPNVLHFSGHGEVEGLVLADDNFDGETVSGEWLKGVLAEKNVSVLVLNCCWSDEILQGLEDEVGVVIGSTQGLPEDHAAEFSKRFYNSLQSGLSVEEAFQRAVKGREGLYHQKIINEAVWKNQLTLEAAAPADRADPSSAASATGASLVRKAVEYEHELDQIDLRLKTNLRLDLITVLGALVAAFIGVAIGDSLGWPAWTKWEPAAIVGAMLANPAGRVASYVAMYLGAFDLRESLKPAIEVMSLGPKSDIEPELANERISLILKRLKKLEEGLTIKPEEKADAKGEKS